jgi:uncharacterized protein involved in type VI secretion and phage assembly
MRNYAVVTGTVKEVNDPEGLGRVKVEFPWMEGETTTYDAPIATMMAGKGRGTWFMPEVGDEVLVGFYQGDVNSPYILGFHWSQNNPPPTTDPQRRLIHSKNGHEIELYDPDPKSGDMGYIRLKDAHGNLIELSNAMIRIQSVGTIQIDGLHIFINGRRVTAAPGTI